MQKIFISYRHKDSEQHAPRIWERLKSSFGTDNVFFDLDSNEIGSNYLEKVLQAIDQTDVMVVIIGPNWLSEKYTDGPKAGKQRILDEEDTLRIELETALKKGIHIIPVLVGGSKMPSKDMLPPSLKEFSYTEALEILKDPRFYLSMGELEDAIKKFDKGKLKEWIGMGLLILSFLGIVFWFEHGDGKIHINIPWWNNLTQTTDELIRIVHVDPNNGPALSRLVGIYFGDLEPDKAYAVLDEVANDQRVSAETLREIAGLCWQHKNWPRLEKVQEHLVQVSSNSPETWFDLARTRAILGQTNYACLALQRALELNALRQTNDPDAQNLLGQCLTEPRFAAFLKEPEITRLTAVGSFSHPSQ